MTAFFPHGEGRCPGEAAQLPPHAFPLDGVAGLPDGKLQRTQAVLGGGEVVPRRASEGGPGSTH